MRTGSTYSRNSVSSVSTRATADLESSAKAADHVLGPLNSNANLGAETLPPLQICKGQRLLGRLKPVTWMALHLLGLKHPMLQT